MHLKEIYRCGATSNSSTGEGGEDVRGQGVLSQKCIAGHYRLARFELSPHRARKYDRSVIITESATATVNSSGPLSPRPSSHSTMPLPRITFWCPETSTQSVVLQAPAACRKVDLRQCRTRRLRLPERSQRLYRARHRLLHRLQSCREVPQERRFVG